MGEVEEPVKKLIEATCHLYELLYDAYVRLGMDEEEAEKRAIEESNAIQAEFIEAVLSFVRK